MFNKKRSNQIKAGVQRKHLRWVTWMFNVLRLQNAELKKQRWSSRQLTTRSGRARWALLLGQSSRLGGENHYVMIEHWKELVAGVESGSASLYGLKPASLNFHPPPTCTSSVSQHAIQLSLQAALYALHLLRQSVRKQGNIPAAPFSLVTKASILTGGGKRGGINCTNTDGCQVIAERRWGLLHPTSLQLQWHPWRSCYKEFRHPVLGLVRTETELLQNNVRS